MKRKEIRSKVPKMKELRSASSAKAAPSGKAFEVREVDSQCN
jgi:hypothetical protein